MMKQKRFKNIWVRTLTLLCVMLGIFCLACACKDDGEKADSSSEEVAAIKFEEKSIALEQGDVYYFVLSGEKEGLQFTVSDDSVIALDDTSIVAKAAGTATVTLNDNGETDMLNVFVTALYEPTIFIDDTVSIYKDGEYKLPVSVCYKGVYDENVNCTYFSKDESIATVDLDGTVQGVANGSTEVTISCAYRFFELTKTVTVNVLGRSSLTLSESNIVLTANPSVETERQNEVQLSISEALYEGETVDSSTMQWEIEEGDDVVTLNEGKVTAISFGTAKIKVFFNIDGEEIYNYVMVTVTKPSIEYTTPIIYYKNYVTFTLPVELGADGADILRVEDASGKEIAGADATIDKNLIIASEEYTTWTVYTKKGDYHFGQVRVRSADIRTADDLLNAEQYGEYDGTAYYGYFTLGNDIDMGDKTWTSNNALARSGGNGSAKGFLGVFDGNNYTIKNFNVVNSTTGLFKYIGAAGVVKNVNFTGAQVSAGNQSGIIAGCVCGATIENVSVSMKTYADSYSKNGGLIGGVNTDGADTSRTALTLRNVAVIWEGQTDFTTVRNHFALFNLTYQGNGFNSTGRETMITMDNVTVVGFNNNIYISPSDTTGNNITVYTSSTAAIPGTWTNVKYYTLAEWKELQQAAE